MIIETTPEQIAKHYSSAMDSVNLINTLTSKPTVTTMQAAQIEANQSHLDIVIAKVFWTTEDLTPFIVAAAVVTPAIDDTVVAAAPATAEQMWERITRLAFRNRFTTAEKVALEIAGLDNPAAPMPARAQAAALRANQADLASATFVDLDWPDTRAGVLMLEAAGLLAVGRALEILDAPVTPEERPA